MELHNELGQYVFSGQWPLVKSLGNNPEKNSLFRIGKKSFLVFNRNKYIVIPTETIAIFCIKNKSTVIVTFAMQEYFINYSLERIQQLLQRNQYFRLNRQYLINCDAIKEVEHYFSRKLLVVPAIPLADKMIVSKENARSFLDWLEER